MATKRKRKNGRPCKLTPEVQEKIVAAIRAGNYAAVAAGYAGIGETTFYRWLQKGREAKSGAFREFWQAVRKAETDAEVRAVAMVQKHMEGNWTAAMCYLERKFPSRWGRRDRLSVEVEPKKALADLLGLEVAQIESAVIAATAQDHERDASD